jgi:hypothetical protein
MAAAARSWTTEPSMNRSVFNDISKPPAKMARTKMIVIIHNPVSIVPILKYRNSPGYV